MAAQEGQLEPRRYTRLTGATGEFHVAAELSRRLWMASITPQGVERTDVLAQHLATRQVIALQVKTAGAGNQFRLGRKLEEPTREENEWVVLVSLQAENERPAFYIIPRNVVAAFIWVDHRRWLAQPARSGRPHKDTDQRSIRPPQVSEYRDRWEWLHEPASSIPYHLPDWFYDASRDDHFGLPPGHPGVRAP